KLLLREALADGSYEVWIKPDAVRDLEAQGERFFPLELAALVHEESSMLAAALREDLIANRSPLDRLHLCRLYLGCRVPAGLQPNLFQTEELVHPARMSRRTPLPPTESLRQVAQVRPVRHLPMGNRIPGPLAQPVRAFRAAPWRSYPRKGGVVRPLEGARQVGTRAPWRRWPGPIGPGGAW